MTPSSSWCHDHHRWNCGHDLTATSMKPRLWLNNTHSTLEPRFQLLVGTDCVAWVDSSKVDLLVQAGVWHMSDEELAAEYRKVTSR